MTIHLRILGKPSRDNSLHVSIDSGQNISRLLFDCGANCLDTLSFSQVQDLDAVFFSHFHMDHVSGFDHFFRCNFDRTTKPNLIFGPPGTAKIIQHRAQGYWWNLNEGLDATWLLTEISHDVLSRFRIELSESFETLHSLGAQRSRTVLENDHFQVRSFQMKHHGPCLAFRIDEKPRSNINMQLVGELGLPPGPWMKDLKSGQRGDIKIGNQTFDLDQLREKLVETTEGESAAYLTDFLLDSETHQNLAKWLADCGTLVCESQYRDSDRALAIRNHHTTTTQVAELAKSANVGRLILFHLSDRYPPLQWPEMLAEVQRIFASTEFPSDWKIRVPNRL